MLVSPVMNTAKTVLYVGTDPDLSKASAALLKKVGYRVRTTTPLNAASVMRDVKVSAVILCATLSRQEADDAVDYAANLQMGVPIVSVHLGLLGDGPHPGSSVVVDALQGPNALVQALESVTRMAARAS